MKRRRREALRRLRVALRVMRGQRVFSGNIAHVIINTRDLHA